MNSEATLICLRKGAKLVFNMNGIRAAKVHARPHLYAPFIGFVVADYVHVRLGELDDTFFLELLYGLDDA